MARTPVFALIRRSLRKAQASLHSDVPLGELMEIGAESALTRRQFLVAGTAAAAAASLASCRTFAPPAKRDAKVIIIGAGIAGLTAGYRLHSAGIDVRIFDGQNRIGGRMFSLRDFFPDDQVAELGGELIDTGHEHLRKIAAELNIELDDLASDDPALGRDLWFFDGVQRSEHDVVEAFRPP